MLVSGEIRARLEALRRHVEESCDPVGDDFPEEARRIHYGEVPHRDIYGVATDDEAYDRTFASWTSATGFDATSTHTPS